MEHVEKISFAEIQTGANLVDWATFSLKTDKDKSYADISPRLSFKLRKNKLYISTYLVSDTSGIVDKNVRRIEITQFSTTGEPVLNTTLHVKDCRLIGQEGNGAKSSPVILTYELTVLSVEVQPSKANT